MLHPLHLLPWQQDRYALQVVLAGSNIECGNKTDPPNVRSNAAVSPIILPMLRIMPVTIPGIEAGNNMSIVVCHLVAPRARLPFFIFFW